MPEILETVMLICFGFSWPMSVYKNIKAKSAKSMSLGFITMITIGYVAGIAAKLVAQRYVEPKDIFVLVVYFINLIMVSTNIFVYFINKGYDKKADANK